MTTREAAIAAAGEALAHVEAVAARMTARDQATAAHEPGGPTVEQLEHKIRALRATRTNTTAA